MSYFSHSKTGDVTIVVLIIASSVVSSKLDMPYIRHVVIVGVILKYFFQYKKI